MAYVQMYAICTLSTTVAVILFSAALQCHTHVAVLRKKDARLEHVFWYRRLKRDIPNVTQNNTHTPLD